MSIRVSDAYENNQPPQSGAENHYSGDKSCENEIAGLHAGATVPVVTRNESLTIMSTDGVELEARIDLPQDPLMLLVLCHPHPQHGGTMRAPLLEKITSVLVEANIAVLRFNFRGIGESTGEWHGGSGEIEDVGAAVDAARGMEPRLNLALGGWSFGAATSLAWQSMRHEPMPWIGIAPPVTSDRTPDLPGPDTIPPARRLFIVGDRDQFVTVAELSAYAAAVGAEIEVLGGSDHFFYFREEKVANRMLEFLKS